MTKPRNDDVTIQKCHDTRCRRCYPDLDLTAKADGTIVVILTLDVTSTNSQGFRDEVLDIVHDLRGTVDENCACELHETTYRVIR